MLVCFVPWASPLPAHFFCGRLNPDNFTKARILQKSEMLFLCLPPFSFTPPPSSELFRYIAYPWLINICDFPALVIILFMILQKLCLTFLAKTLEYIRKCWRLFKTGSFMAHRFPTENQKYFPYLCPTQASSHNSTCFYK